MHPIFYYIIFFIVVGAIGFMIANRKASPAERKNRWLKYSMYILITGIVVFSIFFHFFFETGVVIALIAVYELVKVSVKNGVLVVPGWLLFLAVFLFLFLVAAFLLFALYCQRDFLLFTYMQVIVFDGFCQITGQIAGKHQLAPKISPTKTWEGLAGGWICCIATALSAANWIAVELPVALLFGLLTGLFCFTGDMLASWYKRKVKVKDYSNWLPGQGGFLDRFDSFLATGAIYFVLLGSIFKDWFPFLMEHR